jgi:hypothetical protein
MEFINWICAITQIDLHQIKSACKGDAFKFQTRMWQQFDEAFLEICKQNRNFSSDTYLRAYAFCLAVTYKRQRDKRGDYASGAARTASKFNITNLYSTFRPLYQKSDKIAACEAFINFILDDAYKLTESDLMVYLGKNYKNTADKYLNILKADTLGVLTQYVLKLGNELANKMNLKFRIMHS